jgi:hypothetical protein
MSFPEAGRQPLEKCPSGISGLDEITQGGLPRGPAHAGLWQRRGWQDPIPFNST